MEEDPILGSSSNASVYDVSSDLFDVLFPVNDSFNPFLGVWDTGFQNLSSNSVDDEGGDDEDLPAMLTVRIAIIVAVIVGLIVMACGSYALHKKRVKNSKNRQKYHKTVLL